MQTSPKKIMKDAPELSTAHTWPPPLPTTGSHGQHARAHNQVLGPSELTCGDR